MQTSRSRCLSAIAVAIGMLGAGATHFVFAHDGVDQPAKPTRETTPHIVTR